MAKAHHFKINLTYSFGPYDSKETCKAAQSQIKGKMPKIHFTKMKKSGKGFKFDGVVSVSETSTASSTEIKKAVSAQAQGAKVTVIDMTRKKEKAEQWC